MPKYDRVLIVGDFIIHVCCPSRPLVKDFLNLIDSFNFVQSVTGPTQEHGHTLDLVLSCGLPVFNIEVFSAVFSDHLPVLFEISLPWHIAKPCTPARCCRMFNLSTAVQFSVASKNAAETHSDPPLCFNTEELTSLFYSTCQNILDTVAPFKIMPS